MRFFKRIKNWLLQKAPPSKPLVDDVSTAVARDIGVTITRIRLPSGRELVIVERLHVDDSE